MKKIEKNGTSTNVPEDVKNIMKTLNSDLSAKNIIGYGETVKIQKMDLQMGMTRNIPSINNSLLFFLKSKQEDTYAEEYEKFMINR
jgi:hypothetical protein